MNNKNIDAKKMNEIEKIVFELNDIYQTLKHFPGKHNQEDHAWNAGMGDNKKKRTKKKRNYSSPSFSSARRTNLLKRNYSFNSKNNTGIISPFEAVKFGANQSRVLSANNPKKLLTAISISTQELRKWSDEFKAALSSPEKGDETKLSNDFKVLSKKISQLNDSLNNDIIEQNIFKAIMQSYQNSISQLIPETQKIFNENPLYDKNTPDIQMAKKVESTILNEAK